MSSSLNPGSFGGPAAAGNPSLSITLNWAGGVTVAPGTYIFTGTSPYPWIINSLDASIGTAGGSLTVRLRIAGVAVGGLEAAQVTLAAKTNFPATGDNVVPAGAQVDAVVTVTGGAPTDTFLTINGVK